MPLPAPTCDVRFSDLEVVPTVLGTDPRPALPDTRMSNRGVLQILRRRTFWGGRWDIHASAATEEVCATGDNQHADLRWGFIQTARSIHWTFRFDNWPQGVSLSVTEAPDAQAQATVPFYAPPGSMGGPVDALSGRPPVISDAPHVSLRSYGHASRPVNPLRSASLEANFVAYLVAYQNGANLTTPASFHFLYHVPISLQRQWSAPAGVTISHLDDLPASGQQQLGSHGVGMGSHDPILTGTIANDQLRAQIRGIAWPAGASGAAAPGPATSRQSEQEPAEGPRGPQPPARRDRSAAPDTP